MPAVFALVTTTCGNKPEAEAIATLLVAQRLAACVQMFPIESVYRWEGAVQRADEWMLYCKIKAADYVMVEAAIRGAHAYENPEIVRIDITGGAQAYLAWLEAATTRD